MKNVVKTDPKVLKVDNSLDNALVVMSNFIARAVDKWTLEETKAFLCALSQINTTNDLTVVLSRRDTMKKLGYDPTNGSKLLPLFESMASKSMLEFYENEKNWHFGFLVIDCRNNEDKLEVTFNPKWEMILRDLRRNFTEFYLDQVVEFKHKSSYSLYVWLTSWRDTKCMDQIQKLPKGAIATVFSLTDNQYCRTDSNGSKKFHFGDFEKRCLVPAITEINNTPSCDLKILRWERIKDGKVVLGYDFYYTYVDKDGFRKYPLEAPFERFCDEEGNPYDQTILDLD